MQSIGDWWRHFWDHTDFWNAFWPALIGALGGALVGAIAVTSLERLYRNRERIDREVGECNKLLFILGQMLKALDSINESFFEAQRKKLAREPKWDELGALEGAPSEGPEFIIGEYAFLLEDDDPSSLAPKMLDRAYATESTFKSIIARVNQRSQLWYEYSAMSHSFGRGEDRLASMSVAGTLGMRIKEQTAWLAEEIPESIDALKKLLPELQDMLTKRYPKRRFIDLTQHFP
jgi:hypothetical protein